MVAALVSVLPAPTLGMVPFFLHWFGLKSEEVGIGPERRGGYGRRFPWRRT